MPFDDEAGVGDFATSIGARSAEIGASPSGCRHVGSAADGHPSVPLDLFAYPMMRLLVAARAFGLRTIDGKQVIQPSQIEPTRNAFPLGRGTCLRRTRHRGAGRGRARRWLIAS